MLSEITLQLNTQCNLNCEYCFANKDFNVLSDNNFELFFDFCKQAAIDNIHITGGEPTLHPRFSYIIEKLSEITDLVVYSNLTKENLLN